MRAGQGARVVAGRSAEGLRLTTDGEVRWQHAYSGGEAMTGLAATRDGGLALVGSTSHGPGKTNVWVVRIDTKGDVVWQRVFGAPPG